MPRSLRIAVPVAAVVAVLGWLPFVGRATASDEGGYMLVASQWKHGASLYGSYWVDRPPLLILIHALAADLGGTPALRVIGILCVVASVFLAGALVRAATAGMSRPAPWIAVVAPVVVAATFLTTPEFGTTIVDGELLSVPFVLAGVLACVRACSTPVRRHAVLWSVGAGVAATSAVMVKQNAIDVFVLAGVVLVTRAFSRQRSRVVGVAAVAGVAAVVTLGVFLVIAATRGTSPAGLWNALVTFRVDAASNLYGSASSGSTQRLQALLVSATSSLCPVVVAVLALQAARSRPTGPGTASVPDLRWAALALLAWEVFAIAGGGGFWRHYLLVLVPGMVVLAAAAAQRPPRFRAVLAVVLAAAVVGGGVSTVAAADSVQTSSSDALVVSFLKSHARPGDTAVVAFGRPNILWDTHLRSPYDELWELPVLVRDHRLQDFTRVLRSQNAPTWLVVDGTNLSAWGLDAPTADRLLTRRYHRVADEGIYVVWHRDRVRSRGPLRARFHWPPAWVRSTPDGAPTPSPHAGAPFAPQLSETRR